LKVGELACAVALHAAASEADRISLRTVNARTGNGVRRVYVDAETEAEVTRDDQIKGYETADDEMVLLEPDEIAAAIPQGDKTIAVEAFIDCGDVDTVYFDRPYFVTPDGPAAAEVFATLAAGMRAKGVAAFARAVLFRKLRPLLLTGGENGESAMFASTLKFDYEVTPASEAFKDLPAARIKGEMLELARHIIETKTGKFDPRQFDDRYDSALAELVRAKIAGRKIAAPKRARAGKVIDLMDALRLSAGKGGKAAQPTGGRQKPAASRKAG